MTIAATVKSYIEGRGVAYEVIAHPASGSSHETAEAAHVDEGHIAKGVILKDSAGAVMVVVPGNAWVNMSAIGKELDREMVLAVERDAAGYFPDCDPGVTHRWALRAAWKPWWIKPSRVWPMCTSSPVTIAAWSRLVARRLLSCSVVSVMDTSVKMIKH